MDIPELDGRRSDDQGIAESNERDDVDPRKTHLDGKASLSHIEKGGKSFTIIAAEHSSNQAAQYFQKDIAGTIVNPDDWYFLVEGKDTNLYECRVAKALAVERGIPIDDPILHPFQPDVIKYYLASGQTNNVAKEILIGQLAGLLAKEAGNSDLKAIANFLNVANEQELLIYMIQAAAQKVKDPDGYAARFKQTLEDLIKISNLVSAQVLEYYLRHNPNMKNVVVYLGKAHEEIVEMDTTQIPEALKLSDKQIKSLIIRREIMDKMQLLIVGDIPSEDHMAPQPSPFADPNSQAEATQLPTIADRVSEALTEDPALPEDVRKIIIKWANNLFDLKHLPSNGYEEYLNSNASLQQIWGAARLLADKVEKAKLENRNLTPAELHEAKNAFLKAATTRRGVKMFAHQGDEITVLADNVLVLADIIKKLS